VRSQPPATPDRPRADGEFDPRAVPVRDAATVMLIRDGTRGVEVFMLRRTLSAVFASGMYVFPGGAVDEADRSAEVGACCDGLTDAEASRQLEIAGGGLAYWIAAIRECFEEAGVLLARQPDGHPVRFDEPAVEQRYLAHRAAVHAGDRRLVQLCALEGLRLATDDIHYVSHWITPIGERRRFDTRFFVARAPQAQEPLHDDHETIASLWVRPAEALAQAESGELAMIEPTTKNLELLVPYATADEALTALGSRGRPPTIRPKLRRNSEGRVEVVLPGAPGFDALPELDGRPREE
jgi:8-oxo-dGTP pyrophosphatase MutT (NUDIX family)